MPKVRSDRFFKQLNESRVDVHLRPLMFTYDEWALKNQRLGGLLSLLFLS